MTRREAYRRGHRAEIAAMIFLFFKGYRTLARRWKSPFGELDLVVRRGRTLLFVEVKARKTAREAVESITFQQRRRIEMAASAFLAELPDAPLLSCRFDVVAFAPPLHLSHLPDAWRLGE